MDDTLFDFGKQLAEQAGQMALSYYGNVSGSPKGRFDLVSEADTTIESFLINEIKQRYPHHQIIAEESVQPGETTLGETCWVIDPLDGTVNFLLELPLFSVSIGLLVRGEPAAAWISDPLRSEMFSAERGIGAFLNDEPIRQTTEIAPAAPILISSDFIAWSLAQEEGGPLKTLSSTYGKVRLLGSQALHLCYVAAGRAAAAVNIECRLWDNVAGALILTELGGDFSTFNGQPWFPIADGSPVVAGAQMPCIATHRSITGTVVGMFKPFPL
ncbi:MAG: inositol monophosphatase [Chloroflexi bacterium]|nr:inositol monophosphatase [Chloroflexota bacterium]